MGIYDTRRKNLRWLIDNAYAGVDANLARVLEIQPSQIARVFSRNPKNQRNMGTRLAHRIEDAAGKPRGWMDETHFFPAEPGKETKSTQREAVVVSPFGHKMVPVLDYRTAAVWTASSEAYPITNRTEVLWTKNDALGDRAFGLIIEGESMMDEFYPGDIVVVDPGLTPQPGDFVVAKMKGEEKVTFRRYRARELDRSGHPIVELCPVNGDYPTIVIEPQSKGRVIGTLVEHRKYRRRERISPPRQDVAGGNKP